MGMIIAGFLLIGIVLLVLFDGILHKAMKEPAEHRTAPSAPDGNEVAAKVPAGPAQPEIPAEIPDRL